MAQLTQQTQDLLTKALSDKDTASTADAAVQTADVAVQAATAALTKAQADEQAAQSAATVAHKTSDASAHAFLVSAAQDLGVSLS